MKPINIIKRLNESDGWIALYKGNKVEISKDEANSLYGAKQVAIQKLNVPKSKVSELAIEPAYNDDNLDNAPTSNVQFEAADPEAKFSGVEFEKNIPHEMRFKEYDVLDNDELYWVTQEPFEERDLLDFAKALQETRFNKAYVTVRDLSTYDYNKDKENNVLAVVSAENGIEDLDGYWNEAKVFFDEDVNEAANPDNEEKNKIIRDALKGPKSMRKNKEALKKMGIGASDTNYEYDTTGDDSDIDYQSTIYLRGPNGKQLSVDPDGTNVWKSAGQSEKHYKKELEFKSRHSKNYNNMDRLNFNGDRAKAFDYYNYLTKPENEYQKDVDLANERKGYRDTEGKTGYNLPDSALTPEEKSLNKKPREYLRLKQRRDDLKDELESYYELKKELNKTNREIRNLHSKKNESNLKESRYSEIEENDPVLDKTIKVYDINALLDKELKPSEDGTKYESYDFGTGAAIILKPDGTGCIVDYEAVGTKFNSESEIVDVYLRPNETEVDGHRAIYVMPTAKVQLSIDELLKAPSKDVKVRDFFTKWDYNDRCASNFRGILPYLRDDKITEAIEQKYEKSNPDYTSFLRDVKRYTGSYDYEFGGKVSTECYGYPVTVQYFCYNRPYVGGGYKVVFNVLTPVNTFVGDNIQEALESSFGGYSQTKPTQKEIKDKVLQVVSDIDKED